MKKEGILLQLELVINCFLLVEVELQAVKYLTVVTENLQLYIEV